MTDRMRIGATATLMAVLLALSMVLTASAAPARFGSRLTTDTQPQPALWCDEPNEEEPHADCTWILNDAYGRPDTGHLAPRDGTIGKVRLMSCDPGSLRVQVARQLRGSDGYKVLANGPVIQYQGDPQGCGDDDDFEYTIETFATSLPVKKGDRIAIRAERTGTLRCGSGGDNTWLFDPPLVTRGAAAEPGDNQGCWLLVEWQYKPR
jgi:hypothetical protein